MFRLSTSLIVASGPEYDVWLDAQGRGKSSAISRRTENENAQESMSTQDESPRMESIPWGEMVVEGLPSGKELKLWPGGGFAQLSDR